MAKKPDWIWLSQIAADQTLGRPKPGLVNSMRRFGQMHLVHVRRREDGTFEVVGGQQYAAAARLAGRETLDVVIEDGPDAADPADRTRLAASGQIESVDHLYTARCLARLLAEGGVTHAALAKGFGLSRAHVSHLLRVIECPDLVAMMDQEELAFGAAKALAGLTPAEREPLLRELRLHHAVHDRFPSVAQIARQVAERKGEETDPIIPPRCVAALVAGMQARGRPAAAEIRGVRSKAIQVTLAVEPEDLAWIRALIDGTPEGNGAQQAT